MAEGSVDIPLTPPGEADGLALVEYHEAFEILSLLSANSTTPIDEYEHLSTSSLPSLPPAKADRGPIAMIFDPTATDTTPLIPDRAPTSSAVYYSSSSSSSSSSEAESEAESEEEDEKAHPPLLLSTERTEEAIEIEADPPTQYTVAELLNVIVERGIELPDTDDEEGFETGREGAGMGDLGEEEVLREIELWERERAEAGGDEGVAAVKEKGKGKGVDDGDVESPTSTYSFDEHGTHPKEQKKKRKQPPTSCTSSALSALSTHLAMNEHIVDTEKVLREADEAEARGDSFDMVSRVIELQNGRAADCAGLVDGLGGWLRE